MQLLLFCIFLYIPVISSKISPCAKWSTNGITVAGTGIAGNTSQQLYNPQGIFVHKQTNTLYVADFSNQRVQKFSLNESSPVGITVASGVWWMPVNIHVETDDNSNQKIIYVITFSSEHAEKWIEGILHGERLFPRCRACSGISVDRDKNVYLSSSSDYCIYKWSPQTNTTLVVAGHEAQAGYTDENLFEPRGIYVDQTKQTVYVADLKKNHIQKWTMGANEGPTVAGSRAGESGNTVDLLSEPVNVQVDEETDILYIADKRNHRIQRWFPTAFEGDTIAGGNGEGHGADQLRFPNDLAFDRDGNLFVCDTTNHRIQFFKLIDNQSCKSTSTAIVAIFKMIVLFGTLSILAWLYMN